MFKDVTSVELFLAFFVPGFIIISVWEFLVPSERSDWQSRIPQVVGYSSVYYAVALGPYVLWPGLRSALYPYIAIFVLPVIVAVVFAKLRGVALQTHRGAQATPWDQFFQRVTTNRAFQDGLYIEVVQKDGATILGYFGANSYASTFPNPRALYLQQVCVRGLDDKVTPAEPAQGIYVDCTHASAVRFTLARASQHEAERQTA